MQRLYTKIKLEILGADMAIEGADISLEIKKTNEGQPNYCTCTIYNVSENTYNILSDKTNSIRVYIDTNENGYVLIFQGDLRDIKKWKKYKATSTKTKRGKKRKNKQPVKIHYNEPPITREYDDNNIATIIELQDGTKDTFLNNYYSQSYSGVVTNKKILNDIIYYVKRNTTITLGNIDELQEKTFSNGFILQGTLNNCLKKICRSGNCKCVIENNIVNVFKNSVKSDVYGYYLHSGICPRPEFNADKEISISAPFLPTLNIGNFVKIQFQDIDGVYRVKKFESKVDNFGDEYETNLILEGK